MDRSSSKMLKFIKSCDLCEDGRFYFGSFYDAYCAFAKCSEPEAMACVRYLSESGYIRIGKDQFGASVGFELEHRAYHVFYFQFVEKWQIYVIPVIVTILTTALLRALGWS